MRAPLLAGAGLLAMICLSACVVVDAEPVDRSQHSPTPMAAVPEVEYASGSVTSEGVTLPFSKAVRVDDTIYLSGELGLDYATNTLVPGGTGPETAQIFANMEKTLSGFDADLSDIVKCTVFLDDMATFGDMNAAYTAALPDPKPARSTFGADGLALGAALEIECIAVRR